MTTESRSAMYEQLTLDLDFDTLIANQQGGKDNGSTLHVCI